MLTWQSIAWVVNDQWEVVGLHHAAVPARDGAGNILALDGTIWDGQNEDNIRWIANEGIRISQIVQDIKRQAQSVPEYKEFVEEMFFM